VRTLERAECRLARRDAGIGALKHEVAAGDDVAGVARPHDLRALVGAPARIRGVHRLIVERDEIANAEHSAGVGVHRAGDRDRIGGGIDGGIDRGPEVGGQFIDVVERQRDLVGADDVHVARGVRSRGHVVERERAVIAKLRRFAQHTRHAGIDQDLLRHGVRHHIGGLRPSNEIVH
jgi:hypothetical protein